MKSRGAHDGKPKDDSLYGLLASYKANSCYLRVLESTDGEELVVQLTDNPGKFNALPPDKYQNYRVMSRLELGIAKISLKYLTAASIVTVLGPLMDISIPPEKATIIDGMASEGVYSIVTSRRYRGKVVQGVRKILNMSPQKRYELLEKYFSGAQDNHNG